jgi:hypothetical protein
MAMQLPSPAFAEFTPPLGGGNGASVSGMVIDTPRDEGSEKRGEVASSTNPNSLWILAGAGVALALLIGGDGSNPTTPLSDCADLFDDLFNNGESNTAAAADCGGSHAGQALMNGLITAAFTLPDPGADLPNLESRLAATLLPNVAPDRAVKTMHDTGAATLERLGQPLGSRVTVGLDEFLMPGKTYESTFTVTVPAGTNLDQPLFLVAADLTQAGVFAQELGVPFAVPVDMNALRTTGSWTYATPYTANSGAYFIDAYVSTQLPRMLKSDATQIATVIDRAQQDLDKAERMLNGAKTDVTRATWTAKSDSARAKYLWLLEWSQHVQ